MSAFSDKINKTFEREDWTLARSLLSRRLKREPEDHWLLTRLATAYYEEHEYAKALEIEEHALRIAPDCPLVRWDYASCLDMVNRTKDAIKQWKRLLKDGPESVSLEPCGEGLDWAESLLNDCRYRLALAYAQIGKTPAAIRYMRQYLTNVRSGVSSIYDLPDADHRLSVWSTA